MTREDAIKYLKSFKLCTPYTMDAQGVFYRAIEMAIKALEQEPCEDAISRQAVIDITWEEPSYTDALNVLTEVRDKVKALPSVNPQPKTGHWILAGIQSEEDIDNDNYRYICSECQHSDIHSKDIEVPYCWNCGAKMEGEVKE